MADVGIRPYGTCDGTVGNGFNRSVLEEEGINPFPTMLVWDGVALTQRKASAIFAEALYYCCKMAGNLEVASRVPFGL